MSKLSSQEKIDRIEILKKIHPNYNFTDSKFIDSSTKIKYICPKHNEISQGYFSLKNGVYY